MNKTLFDTVAIGTLKMANRFVRSATWEGMCEPDGTPTRRLAQFYARLARGGVGLIITGYTFVRPDGKQLPGKMGIHSDALIPALAALPHAVHEAGGRVFCQLVHAGGQTSSKTIGTTPLAPSSVSNPNFPETPRELSEEDIAALVEAFAQGARRAKEAGFDGVQLHGAHGYLINQFLSPLTNRRSDRYGGSLLNRMRFLEETFLAVRRAVGPGYPVTIKLNAADNLPGALEIDDSVRVAIRLEEMGIDAIEVSSGTAASGDLSPVRQGIESEEKEAYNAPFAQSIKKKINIPVMVVGGLRSCSVMQNLLRDGVADMFALSRPLIREPDLVSRWRQDPTHRATCTSCNGCFRPGLKEGGIYCVLDRKG
ncbi:MAG: NADH-dependent flavin oxidoreductase [Desulfuromonas sp.]|uniref:NADH:flavin oxidoreductase n=1 Tax=Desulfuromonas sp. TaxID=892 RepID=UPI000CBBED78|nr:NADH:flavin oxidoreductase [Desulfuromonas sp.]PLX85071.1 MAG: NADH-dependent flavin oxidoreductase [Desulfuromonas sp.]